MTCRKMTLSELQLASRRPSNDGLQLSANSNLHAGSLPMAHPVGHTASSTRAPPAHRRSSNGWTSALSELQPAIRQPTPRVLQSALLERHPLAGDHPKDGLQHAQWVLQPPLREHYLQAGGLHKDGLWHAAQVLQPALRERPCRWSSQGWTSACRTGLSQL